MNPVEYKSDLFQDRYDQLTTSQQDDQAHVGTNFLITNTDTRLPLYLFLSIDPDDVATTLWKQDKEFLCGEEVYHILAIRKLVAGNSETFGTVWTHQYMWVGRYPEFTPTPNPTHQWFKCLLNSNLSPTPQLVIDDHLIVSAGVATNSAGLTYPSYIKLLLYLRYSLTDEVPEESSLTLPEFLNVRADYLEALDNLTDPNPPNFLPFYNRWLSLYEIDPILFPEPYVDYHYEAIKLKEPTLILPTNYLSGQLTLEFDSRVRFNKKIIYETPRQLRLNSLLLLPDLYDQSYHAALQLNEDYGTDNLFVNGPPINLWNRNYLGSNGRTFIEGF